MKKFLLIHTHLLLILIIICYQHHILQWKKLDKVFKESTSPSTLCIGVILCWVAKKETGRCMLSLLIYHIFLMLIKEGSPSYLPTENTNSIICIKININTLFFWLPLIICLEKTLTYIQNCCVFVETTQVIFNMIHQQHDNCHLCHFLSCPLKAPVLPFLFVVNSSANMTSKTIK